MYCESISTARPQGHSVCCNNKTKGPTERPPSLWECHWLSWLSARNRGGNGSRRFSVFAINNCYRAMLPEHCSRFDPIPTHQGEECCAAQEVFIEFTSRQSQDRARSGMAKILHSMALTLNLLFISLFPPLAF